MIKMALAALDLPARKPCRSQAEAVQAMSNVHRIVEVLKGHGLSCIYGFAIGENISPETEAILKYWEDAGHRLANHSFTHTKFKGDAESFFRFEVKQTEGVLARFRSFDPTWFSYPSAFEGGEDEESKVLRNVLMRGFKILRPSLEYPEGEFNRAFARCQKSGDAASFAELQELYLEMAASRLEYLCRLGKRILGREISHIYGHHVGEFTANVLDRLLSCYEALGVSWVPLDEAMGDPVYNGNYHQIGAKSILHQVAESLEPGLYSRSIEEQERLNPVLDRLAQICPSSM